MPLQLPLDRAFACHAYAYLPRPRDAERLLTGLAARDFSDVPYNGFWLTVMALVADAAARAAAPQIVDELHELLSPWRDQLVVTQATCLGSVAHYVGVLATRLDRPANADDAFAQATEVHERTNAPIWTARTRLEWGRSLITRDHERGLAQLSLASAAAHALGAHGIVAEAAALARS